MRSWPARYARRGRVRPVAVALVWASCCLGCGADGRDPGETQAALGGEVVALVDDEPIHAATVALIAREQGVPPEAARTLAVRDALLARQARDLLAGTGALEVAERRAAARELLEQLMADARAAGPPTPAELSAETERQWVEVDRPPSARTIHAVVLVKDPSQAEAARLVGERLKQAVAGISAADDFERRARQLKEPDFNIRVERLPPVTADGRVVELEEARRRSDQRFEPDFARAANAIPEVGQQSPLVETRFGFHVILLIERLPELRIPKEELDQRLTPDVYSARAELAAKEILSRAYAANPVVYNRALETWTARLRFEEPTQLDGGPRAPGEGVAGGD